MNPADSGFDKPSTVQVHDRFFKEAFSRPEILADFIQAYLPGEFATQLQLETLNRRHDSHIDHELASHFVDLLFEVNFGKQAITIALLLEHKSYPEPYPHFQLNRYLLNYWADQIKAKQPLQPVVPILIYHGRVRWKQRPLKAYFPRLDSQLVQFLPDFHYYFINLNDDSTTDLALLKSNYGKLTAGLLNTV